MFFQFVENFFLTFIYVFLDIYYLFISYIPYSKKVCLKKLVSNKKLYFKLFEILQCKTEYEFRKNQQPLGKF